MKSIILFLLKVYKIIISPALVVLFGHGCRFSPTCSQYSAKVIEEYGLKKGIVLSFNRLSRCQPFTKI